MSITVRGIEFQDNLDNPMGIEFYNLSHRFGYQCPNWPYFKDVRIERMHYMAKSGVLSQTITTTMHVTTHIDAPAHVVQGTPFIDEVPLPHFFGSGIVVSIPKKKWEPITYDDLEKACGHAIRKGDVLIINTGWHKEYEDGDYFAYCPGFVPSAADWMVEKGVKVVGHDTQANDHPLATAIGATAQRSAPSRISLKNTRNGPAVADWKDDFPEWEPVHQKIFKAGILGIENVGGDLDAVTGKRCTFAFFPNQLGSRRWLHHPPGGHDRQGPELPHREG
ncbi:cyclase superfamily protein [Agrobacterium tumefaciens]|nr:cyclase superfamily protein [Agrobacterium tumefaciens]